MVRLDAKYRWGFRYGRMFKENSRIVVSSKLEAQHFIDYGNFPKDNLYITGLAQWDRIEYNSLSKEADKIMIIPTWRHWELSEARVTPQNTGYYKLMERIVSNIPKKFKHQILLVPHPLFIDFFKDTDLNEFIPKDYMNWISLLNQTKVLITDYSSFSYLAFYKGCNVIFDWSDLDECMKVGYDGALMLNKDNAFGDIIYNEKDKLPTLIKNNIDGDRKDEYIKNFNQIIEFRDGNNADRILDMIKKDGFL
jgi:CDP-glycerol glycerophosphotransferase (TagB/SpsB family)